MKGRNVGQKQRAQPTTKQQIIGATVVVVAALLIVSGYSAEWTGLPGKTFWDWLQLLIVPAVIAAGGIWFNRQQRKRELYIENQRAQDNAVQSYLDQITQLLI